MQKECRKSYKNKQVSSKNYFYYNVERAKSILGAKEKKDKIAIATLENLTYGQSPKLFRILGAPIIFSLTVHIRKIHPTER